MTGKRFIKCVRGVDDYDVWDKIKNKGLSHNDVVTLLNEQDKQVQSYRIDYGQLVLDFEELKHEEEQLKQQVRYLKVVCRNELDEETLKQVMGSLGDVE